MIVNEKKEHNRHNMVDSYKIMENGFERKKKNCGIAEGFVKCWEYAKHGHDLDEPN